MFRVAIIALAACSLCAAQTSTPPSTTPAKSQTGSTSQSSKTAANPAAKPGTSASSTATTAKTATGEVPPTTAVITIPNLCLKPDAAGKCQTVVTRAEFDRLASALNPQNGTNPPLNPEMKRQIATRYSQFLTLGENARKQGLDKNPRAQELIHFAELQALAQLYMSELQAKSTPTAAEVDKFYTDNRPRFEKMTVERILIPANPGPDAKGVTADSLKQTAQKIDDRAKAGEDFNTLQKEAFAAAGLSSAPDAKMVLNPASLPPSQASVRQLKPGEVSPMFTEPSGEYIYKMVSSEVMPLASVRTEIERNLQRQKFEQEAKQAIDAVKPDLNEAYFGPPPTPGKGPADRD